MPTAAENAKRAAIAGSKGLPQVSDDVQRFIVRYGENLWGDVERQAEDDMARVRAELLRRQHALIVASGGHPEDLD
jgi:hypothetical protein